MYYESAVSQTEYTITQPTEITDAENIQSHYAQRVTTNPLGTSGSLAVKNLVNYQ